VDRENRVTLAKMFEAIGVQKKFGTHVAIRDVTLSLPEKAVTALIGPSGSGKSTLVRLFLGFIRPSSGQVLFRGKPIESYDPIRFKQTIGLVVQSGGLFPHLSAEDNVSIIGQAEKWPKELRLKRV